MPITKKGEQIKDALSAKRSLDFGVIRIISIASLIAYIVLVPFFKPSTVLGGLIGIDMSIISTLPVLLLSFGVAYSHSRVRKADSFNAALNAIILGVGIALGSAVLMIWLEFNRNFRF